MTSPAYQARIAFKALDELVLAVKVRVDIGQKFHSATEDSLSRTCAPVFTEIFNRFAPVF